MTRAIGFGAQAAGIGVQGLLDTFLPAGASQMASSNWITRIAGGIAGARPQIPNVAGMLGQQAQQAFQAQQKTGEVGPVTATQQAPSLSGQHQGTGAQPGPREHPVNLNVNVNNTRAPDVQSTVEHHQMGAWQAPGR